MIVRLVVKIIEFYQRYIACYIGPCCRFYPTCSEYSKAAFIKYGFFLGMIKTIIRIFRCNPFSKGGYDPLL